MDQKFSGDRKAGEAGRRGSPPKDKRAVTRRVGVCLLFPLPKPDPTPARSGTTVIRWASSAPPKSALCWWIGHIAVC
jgi:hypothetical protein